MFYSLFEVNEIWLLDNLQFFFPHHFPLGNVRIFTIEFILFYRQVLEGIELLQKKK